MRYLLLILILSFTVKAQAIFADSFEVFIDTTGMNLLALWVQNDSLRNLLEPSANAGTDLRNSYDMTASGTFTPTSGSVMMKGGNHLVYGGTTDFYQIVAGSAGDFNPGLSDWSILAVGRINTPTQSIEHIFSKFTGTSGWKSALDNAGNSLFVGVLDGTDIYAGRPQSDNKYFYLSSRWDRDGNNVIWLYQDTLATDAVDFSSKSAVNIAPSSIIAIGTNTGNTAIEEWSGGIEAVAFVKSYLTDAQIKRFIHTPWEWTSDNGNVGRYNWGWHMGIKLSSGSLTVGYATGNIVEGGAITLSPTGDSTRYTYDINQWQNSNQIIFATVDDNLAHSIPDTTFLTGYQGQLVFDAWTETVYGETYVLIDNVSVSTYEIPATPVSKSNQLSRFDMFDNMLK